MTDDDLRRNAGKCILLHHGTSQGSAQDLLQNGVDANSASVWNGSGEFWATTDHADAEWFARANPDSPPANCFEFVVPESVLARMLQSIPPELIVHGGADYEFLPASYGSLNHGMISRRVVPVV